MALRTISICAGAGGLDLGLRDEDNLKALLKPVWDGFVDAGILQDDRIGMLTVAGVSVHLADGFWPGGNVKIPAGLE